MAHHDASHSKPSSQARQGAQIVPRIPFAFQREDRLRRQARVPGEHLDRLTLQKRLLLCLYALGTNTGLKRMSGGDANENYKDLLYHPSPVPQ